MSIIAVPGDQDWIS